ISMAMLSLWASSGYLVGGKPRKQSYGVSSLGTMSPMLKLMSETFSGDDRMSSLDVESAIWSGLLMSRLTSCLTYTALSVSAWQPSYLVAESWRREKIASAVVPLVPITASKATEKAIVVTNDFMIID